MRKILALFHKCSDACVATVTVAGRLQTQLQQQQQQQQPLNDLKIIPRNLIKLSSVRRGRVAAAATSSARTVQSAHHECVRLSLVKTMTDGSRTYIAGAGCSVSE